MVLAALARSALELLDLFADRARCLVAIPCASHLDAHAELVLGSQGLAEATFVVGDKMGRRRKNVPGAAIVSLQANDLCAWKIVFETQDVVDLGTAPAVDRLVVIADAAYVFG